MPSTFTPNLNLELQATGEHSGTWGGSLNNAVFTIIDNVLGGVQTISLGSSNVTLTTTQAQNNFIKLTGTLTANVIVTFPAIGRNFFVRNATTGAFTVTLACAGGGTSVVIAQGAAGFYITDATDVVSTARSTVEDAIVVLKSETTPAQTAAGQLSWDNDHKRLAIGDGSATLYAYPGLPAYGQAQFRYTSATVCTLMPYRGNFVAFPSGLIATIPSAGIASTITNAYLNGTAGQTLAATTLYYAYLWNQGSVASPNYVIDWSITGHTTDTTTGIEIKSGDATRVLVGMVRTGAGPTFADSSTNRLVASWFNRPARTGINNWTTNRTTTSTAYIEINTEIRINFVAWSDEVVTLSYAGNVNNSNSGITVFSGVGLDGVAANLAAVAPLVTNSGVSVAAGVTGAFTPSEGYHYATIMGATTGATTATWFAASETGKFYMSIK